MQINNHLLWLTTVLSLQSQMVLVPNVHLGVDPAENLTMAATLFPNQNLGWSWGKLLQKMFENQCLEMPFPADWYDKITLLGLNYYFLYVFEIHCNAK
mgnify:CR=1 FL=1